MIDKRKVYAIIPARGGSKGVPKKNIKKLNGIPLINYSIKYAQSSYIDNIIITTDCNDIKEIVSESFPNLNKIKILNRPSKFATDEASTESVIKHVIDSNSFEQNAILILLQPTSPLRPKNSLNKLLEKFIDKNYDSLLTLSPIHPLTWKINDNNIKCMYDYLNRPRRQDINPKDYIYDENGSVYIFSIDIFKKEYNRLGGKIGYFIFSEDYGRQIDTKLDFNILESISKHLEKDKNE